MKKFLNLKIIIPVVVIILLLGVVGYILFAPSTWWKPFYVKMEVDGSSTVPAEAQAAGMPQTTNPSQAAMPAQPGDAQQQFQQGNNIQQPPGIMYELDNKVVNLAEPGGLRYLQASIVLELWPLVDNYYSLEDEEQELAKDEFIQLIDARRPIIDDIVTTQLSSKAFNEIATVEGKQELKEDLIIAINDVLGYQGVTNVYFTSFVVQ